MTQQMTLDLARKLGDTGMRRAASSADRRIPDFSRRVCEYCLTLLALEGPMSGETLVERARAAGFDAPDGRAYGQAFRMLAQRAVILRSDLPRRHGRGTSGGRLYGARA